MAYSCDLHARVQSIKYPTEREYKQTYRKFSKAIKLIELYDAGAETSNPINY